MKASLLLAVNDPTGNLKGLPVSRGSGSGGAAAPAGGAAAGGAGAPAGGGAGAGAAAGGGAPAAGGAGGGQAAAGQGAAAGAGGKGAAAGAGPAAKTKTAGGPVAKQPQSPNSFGYVFWILIAALILMLFMSSRGKSKQEKARRALLAGMKRGDRVVTIGGLVGSIVEVRGDEVVLKVDESNNVKVVYLKSAVQKVIPEGSANLVPDIK